MQIEFAQVRAASPEEPSEPYEEELHDVNAIIMDMCAALGDSASFEFHVSGFGDETWPVDVTTDLATFLEQLPNALSACAKGETFQIDFFEQGVQRRLDFVRDNAVYRVTCSSGTSWTPTPTTETVAREALLAMLTELGQRFVVTVRTFLPVAAAHPWFAEYARAVGST